MRSNRDKFQGQGRQSGYRPPQYDKKRKEINDRRKKQLSKEFDEIDENGDGVLSQEEIQKFMEKKVLKQHKSNLPA